jgi:hypothetical protein
MGKHLFKWVQWMTVNRFQWHTGPQGVVNALLMLHLVLAPLLNKQIKIIKGDRKCRH